MLASVLSLLSLVSFWVALVWFGLVLIFSPAGEHGSFSASMEASGTGSATSSPRRVAVNREQVVILGRYLYVFRPVIDSILDTIFWGDGYKSVAHIVMLSYLSYHHLCGIRFMFLFTVFHFFMKAGKRSECSEEEAIVLFKATVHDLCIVLRRYKPSLAHVWPFLVGLVLCLCTIELILEQSVIEWIDVLIGPLTVVVIFICYGLVDPRYTRNYTTPAPMLSASTHSRTSSQGGGGAAASVDEASPLKKPSLPISPLTLSPTMAFAAPTAPSRDDLVAFDQGGSAALKHRNGSIASTSSLTSPPMASSPSNGPALRPKYAVQDTPTAPWDELLPPHANIPLFMHKVIMLYTRAPDWSDWKIAPDTIARNHPISWTVVKAGLNAVTVRGVTFDDAVAYINDDPDFSKPLEKLHVWHFDKLLGEFRRLAVLDQHTKVVHMVYKQIIFGVAPRDAPMYIMSKELTPEEIAYYGLNQKHVNNNEVIDGGVGRVFISSSGPAEGVPPVKGHVRCVVHRQVIIIRELPGGVVQMMTLVCGEPGGNVPARIVDMTRGEQLKVVQGMREGLLRWHKQQKRKTN